MEYVFLLLQKMYLLCFFLTILLRIVQSLYEIDNNFINVDFYESFSTPKECFNIYHNYPSGPVFLLIDIEYGFYKNKSRKALKKITQKYQLKRINIPCISSLKFPTLEDGYSKIILIFELFLYYNESSAAISIYKFYTNFDPIPLIIITTKDHFGMQVEFSSFVNQVSINYHGEWPEIKSYLLSLRKDNGLICVITEKNAALVLWPKTISLINKYLITGIRIEYTHNKTRRLKEYYPAFECYLNNNYSMESVYLIYNHHSNIRLNLVYFDLNIMKDSIFQTSFSNLIMFSVDIMNILPINAKILLIGKTNRKINFCKNNVTTIEFISESNISYYKISQKMVDISYRVKRCKWVSD